MPLEYEELTEKIIGAAIEVHRRLGPGFIESIYEKALLLELRRVGLRVQQQHELVIAYDGVEVGRHRLDLFVEHTIVVEIKAIKNLEGIHFAIVKSYLKASGKRHGLLLNFAKTTLEANGCCADDHPGFLASSEKSSLDTVSKLTNGDPSRHRRPV